MCILCSSHTNMDKGWAEIAIMIEDINPEKGHVYLCQCNRLVQQAFLVNDTDCPHCGHQILQPKQLASRPEFRILEFPNAE